MLYLLLINFTHFACINSFYHHNNSKKQVLLVSIYILWNQRTQLCLTLCDPMDCSPQAPLSMEFSRQEYWSGLPFPPPGDLPNPGIEPRSPTLQADSFPTEPPGKPLTYIIILFNPYKNSAVWVLSLFNRWELKVKDWQNLNNLWKEMQQAAEVKFA